MTDATRKEIIAAWHQTELVLRALIDHGEAFWRMAECDDEEITAGFLGALAAGRVALLNDPFGKPNT